MTKEKKKAQKKNVSKKPQDNQVNIKKSKVVVEEVTNTEKEVIKKEKNRDSKKHREKLGNAFKAVDNNRKAILFGIVGFLIATLLFRCILWPDRIATLKDGTQPVANLNGEAYTADKFYEELKDNYSTINIFLNDIDNTVLTEKYPENDDMNDEVNANAQSYFAYYEQVGYSKEQFLSQNGFSSEQQFIDILKLDYRRNKYFDEYVNGLVEDKEIEKYYEKDVFGDIDSKHMLVKIDESGESGLKKEEALKLAKEIISKLDSGKTWDEVVTEYKDKIVSEDLGYQAFNASLESAYLKECRDLEVEKYSKTPVLTSYGYHVVYKKAQKDKPKLDDVRDDIIEVLASQKKSADNNLYYKALIKMREDAKLEFVDTVLEKEYKKYVDTYK